MPIYEYKCEHCGHQLEMLQKISDEPAKTCPACGQNGLKKLVSAAAFKLKGTGWYETDFKDKKPKAETKAKADSTSTKDKKSETKSDTSSTDSKTTPKKAASSD